MRTTDEKGVPDVAGERKHATFAFTMLAAVLTGMWLMPGRSDAHNSGRVELFISKVEVFRTEGGAQVSVRLVDRDSATPASGFRIVAGGESRTGGSVGPVALEEVTGEAALYRTVLPLTPGEWTLKLQSQQGDSSLPALSSSKRVDLEVDEFGNVVVRRGDGGSVAQIGVTAAIVLAGAAGGGFVLMRRRRPAVVLEQSEAGPVAAGAAGAVRSR